MKIWSSICGVVVLVNACSWANRLPTGNHFSTDYANLPVSFEANIGQADSGIEFLAHGHNGNLLLTSQEAWLTLQNKGKENEPGILRLKLAGANTHPKLEGLVPLPGKVNYFSGNDPGSWRTDVPTFAKVKYSNVYPGVDLVYYGNQQKLEYDFIVQPGADPNNITLEFAGAYKITLDANGDLLIGLLGDSVRQHKPVVYQEIDGKRKLLSGEYVLRSGMQVGFQVGDYDKTKPLIIDPVLSYSATFGGNGLNQALGIAVDAQDNVYVTGNTTSSDFPIVNAFQTNYLGNQDVFVTKFDTNGAIVFSTYLGGGILNNINQSSSGQGIVVDRNGDVFVTGYTQVTNFPTQNALQPTNGGSWDIFVTEINSNGNALVFSTYLGGKGVDAANGIALSTNADVIITGYTASTNFPTVNATQPIYGGNGDAFVAKLNSAGSALVYSTYLGGTNRENIKSSSLLPTDSGGGVAVDFGGNAYVTGWTYSTNFPVLNAFQKTNATSFYGLFSAAFVTKLDPAGNLVYSTYFGGQLGNFARAIGVDFIGNVYFAGNDMNGSLPTTNAFQPSFGGNGSAQIGDGFVAALDSTGTNLIYCTYLGGSGDDQINGIAVRPEDGAVAVTGFTDSPNFPILNAIQPGGNQGFFKSANGAGAWNLSNAGLASGIIYAIQVDSSNPLIVYTLTKNGFFKSTDGGANWVAMNNGLGTFLTSSYGSSSPLLALDPLHLGTLYVGGYSGVFKTTNGAANWSLLNSGLPDSPWIQAVAVDPGTPTTLYVGTQASGVSKSVDGGNTWNVATNGLNNLNVGVLLIDSQNSSNLFAGVDNPSGLSLFKSTNGGASWTLLGGGLASGPGVMLAANASVIYTVVGNVTESARLYSSTNGGVNWTQLLQSQGLKFTALAVAAMSGSAPALTIARAGSSDNISWPDSFGGYVLQSTALLNPTNWQNISQLPTTNNGSIVMTVPMSGAQGYYRLISTNGTSSQPTLYLGTDAVSGQGVLKSTDGGINWNTVGFAGDTINALAINPANPVTVYTGLDGGRDSFVSTLTPDGQLDSSTYMGGSGVDQGNAVAMMGLTTVVAAGSTTSSDFPIVAAPAVVHKSKLKSNDIRPLNETGTDAATRVAQGIFMVLAGAQTCPGELFLASAQPVNYTVNSPADFRAMIQEPGTPVQAQSILVNGQLPSGLSIDGTSIKGAFTQAGTYKFTVIGTYLDCSYNAEFTITVTN